MAKIVAFGELLWDLLPGGKVLGGAPANFIFRANTLGDDGTLVTRVGNDELGIKAKESVQILGLSNDFIQTDYEFPTGTVEVELDKKGIPDFNIITEVAYDHIEIDAEMINKVREADCLYFGTLIQRYGISKNTLRELIKEAKNAIKFVDINLRKDCYTAQTINDSLKAANILKINDEELLQTKQLLTLKAEQLHTLAGEIISKYDIDIVLVTLGEKGAFLLSNTNKLSYDAGYQIKLIDTIGSGDAFSAGFISTYLKTKKLKKSLKFGNATGALAATTTGATTPFSKENVTEFMKKKNNRSFDESINKLAK